MFKDVSEIKEFILWCKDQKVRRFKSGEVEFALSNAALYVPSSNDLSATLNTTTNTEGDRPAGQTDSDLNEEFDDETLFHSAD